jgi:predicted RNA binding protein YcfA (HicA-like mRNA interferase family)
VDDLKALLRDLRKDGYTVTRAKRTHHFKVWDKAGRLVTVTSSTASDWRSLKNFRGRVRRAEAAK